MIKIISKQIAFAYPTSHHADMLGFYDSGCWYISQLIQNTESGQYITIIAHNSEGFKTPDDPDLISLFKEYGGEIDKSFIKYGNPKALNALGIGKE